MVSSGPEVIAHDVTTDIPFMTGGADVVYHAAVLEHIRKKGALAFMKECYRVLKVGGIVRVGVPDLERICRLYLKRLEAALTGQPGAADDYDWMMIEMLDQMTREESGGAMLEYLKRDPIPNECFVYDRIGHEGRKIVESVRHAKSFQNHQRPGIARLTFQRTRRFLQSRRREVGALVLGSDMERPLAIGRFRLSGEVHQWMYDRFSLARLMVEAGFHEPQVRSAKESAIQEWSRFELDTRADGSVNKPDLFFMEAIKPGKPGQ